MDAPAPSPAAVFPAVVAALFAIVESFIYTTETMPTNQGEIVAIQVVVNV